MSSPYSCFQYFLAFSFQNCSLHLILGMDFFVFILFSIHSASWNYSFVSLTKFMTFSANTSSNNFSAPFFSPFILRIYWYEWWLFYYCLTGSWGSVHLFAYLFLQSFFSLLRLSELYCSVLKFTDISPSSSLYHWAHLLSFWNSCYYIFQFYNSTNFFL